MISVFIGYGLACAASLVGNLAIEAARLLRADGAPAWAEPLNWAFTATLFPVVFVLTLPLMLVGRRGATARH